MGVPNFQAMMLPLLRFLSDGKEHSVAELVEVLAKELGLTGADLEERLPSGNRRFRNRINWACVYLRKAGLIENTARGILRITHRGLGVLRQAPEVIDVKFLSQFPEFVEFHMSSRNSTKEAKEDDVSSEETPEEALERSYQALRKTLAQELLEQIKSKSPDFFERLVVDLLLQMGYGGSFKDAGQAIGKTGDGGVDGIIKEDKLGLDVIYIQAKRWEGTVGRSEVQAFAGSLEGHRAKKGVFITTSRFSNDAHEYVEKIEKRIVLIDGETLAQLMIDYNVGVSTVASYEIKRIDLDYFADDSIT
ncbi:MAG TPA: restriction endonuclease [Firmicutes bacterium]|nr:restriction endonuclease [Bacillota bacterium]